MHPEAIAQLIIDGCDAAERSVREAVAGAPAVINWALDQVRVGWPVAVPLPGWLKEQIAGLILAAVEEAAQLLLEGIALFRMLARAAGRPSVLRAAADTLATDVGAAGDRLSGAMTPEALKALNDDGWDSPASESYSAAFTEQVRAVDRVPESSRALERTLRDLADSLDSFFGELQWAWAGFVITVAGLAVAIATAGPTLGIGAIVGIALSAIGAIMALASIIMAFVNSANRNAGLADALTASPAVSWPSSAFAV